MRLWFAGPDEDTVLGKRGFHFSHAGLWAQTLWGACIVRQTGVPYGDVGVHTFYYGILGVVLAVIVLLCYFKPMQEHKTREIVFDTGAVCLMIIASFLLSVPLPVSGEVTAVTGAILGAVGAAWLLLRWGKNYAQMPGSVAFWYILASFVVYLLILSVANSLTGIPAFLVLTVLAIISSILLNRSLENNQKTTKTEICYTKESFWTLWKIMLGIAIYGFVLGMRKGLSIQVENPLISLICHLFAVIIVIVLMYWVFGKERTVHFSRLFQIFMVLFATGFLFYPFATGYLREFISSLFTVAVALIFMLIWLALTDIAHHSSLHPYVVVGAGWALYGLPRPIAGFVTDYLYAAGEDNYPLVLSLFLSYGIFICAVFLLGEHPRGSRSIFADLVSPVPLPELFNQIDKRCLIIGEAHGLSKREVEVIQHIGKGRTKGYIAETLFISENTVRGHTKNAYTKLEVHSKQELLRLIGVEK